MREETSRSDTSPSVFFPGFGGADLFLPQDRDEYKYTPSVIAGHVERKRRGDQSMFVCW